MGCSKATCLLSCGWCNPKLKGTSVKWPKCCSASTKGQKRHWAWRVQVYGVYDDVPRINVPGSQHPQRRAPDARDRILELKWLEMYYGPRRARDFSSCWHPCFQPSRLRYNDETPVLPHHTKCTIPTSSPPKRRWSTPLKLVVRSMTLNRSNSSATGPEPAAYRAIHEPVKSPLSEPSESGEASALVPSRTSYTGRQQTQQRPQPVIEDLRAACSDPEELDGSDYDEIHVQLLIPWIETSGVHLGGRRAFRSRLAVTYDARTGVFEPYQATEPRPRRRRIFIPSCNRIRSRSRSSRTLFPR